MVRYVECQRQLGVCEGKNLKGIPTWVLEDWNGQELARHYGLRTMDQLLAFASCQPEE